MYHKLFEINIHTFKEQKVREAVALLHNLADDELLDTSLDGRLDAIAESIRFVVAKLKPSDKKGKRLVEKRLGGDGREHELTMIEVVIPFDGWPKSFSIAPSHCNVIEALATIDSEGLKVMFYDDHNLEGSVNSFVERVSQNLERLSSEMQSFRTELKATLRRVADQRLATIRERKERDSKMSFPID